MEGADLDGLARTEETVSDSLTAVAGLMNSSKRKTDDSDVGCDVGLDNPPKRLCQDDCSGTTDSQIVTVIFQSPDIARKYSEEIADYIAQLTKSEITTFLKRDGKSCLQFYKDSKKSDDIDDDTQKANLADGLPQYNQTFTGVIGMSSGAKEARNHKPKNVCFNCEGDHMIAMCPEPRDASRIARNRRERADKNPVYNRYHEEADQRFGHMTPGRISAGLREALGLHDDELPLHTYRMRVQGYPPGWLRSARLRRSNISVHHEPAPESDKDAGKSTAKEEEHYDLNKLISFPGFNVKCTDGHKDDHRRKGFPPMPNFWLLHAMKKRLRRESSARRTGHLGRPADLPSVASRPSDRTTNTGDGSGPETVKNGGKEGSPSLEALEEQRLALLNSLDEPVEDGEDEEEGELEEEEEEKEGDEVSDLVHAPPAASSTPQPSVLTPGASRRCDLGTPVAAGRAHVVYDAEKWSAGITEHIPYENLPGATGAWDRMSSLMKRVRDQLAGKS